MRSPTGLVLLVVLIILANVWREGGDYAVRSWFRAKFWNDPLRRPQVGRGAAR